ncbi:CapA family protein [Actibacterium sp. D379-3]
MTAAAPIRIFLAGDVMLGRGIDQIMPQHNDPVLYESYVTSALDYVWLAERAGADMPRDVAAPYVWGDLLAELDRRHCDLRLINLETAITTSDRAEPKGINYRMHPGNAGVLTAARIDACVLANNHVMDWGAAGLVETLETLAAAGVGSVGAGRGASEAAVPLVLPVAGKGRVIVLAFASASSGVPAHWGAGPLTPGVNPLSDDIPATLALVAGQIDAIRRPGDIVMVSLHWGGNWGYAVPHWQRALAHALIEQGGVDIVHGHSSHHPKAAERYRGKLILYGCGDLLNDYEGIGGHDAFPTDLALAYVADLDPGSGALRALEMLPYRIHAFRLMRAGVADSARLAAIMQRECAMFGGGVTIGPEDTLHLDMKH